MLTGRPTGIRNKLCTLIMCVPHMLKPFHEQGKQFLGGRFSLLDPLSEKSIVDESVLVVSNVMLRYQSFSLVVG